MAKLTPGAKTTDLAPQLSAARQSGFLTRVSDAVRYAIAGVTPDTWMSPNQSMTPAAPDTKGRQLDYPVGINLRYTPRSGELTSFQQLRALADNCDLVRLAIETRKDQMSAQVWSVVHADPDKNIANDSRADLVEQIFKRRQLVF